MSEEFNTVRIWVGWQPLVFELLKKILDENGIEYFESEATGLFLAGGRLERSLWVKEDDAGKALALLEEADDDIAEAMNMDDHEVMEGDKPR